MTDEKICDERHDRIDARLKLLEASMKDFGELAIAIRELAVETKYMREDVNKHNDRLDKLETKDTCKWEKFKWVIVSALVSTTVGIIIGYFALQAGLK